jgi:hypothetical protein
MQNNLIASALRALSRRKKFKPTEDLRRYLVENNIGTWTLDTVHLGPAARERLQAALERDHQVPPGTSAEDWAGITRTEALSLTTNEKSTLQTVRSARVAIKALRGSTLRMGENDIVLPDGINLDVRISDAKLFERHRNVILVENWEAFERIDRLSFEVEQGLACALVVYRGQPGGYTIQAARAFLKELDAPVHVFSDPDPAGLKLAMDFPGFAGLVFPSLEELQELFNAGRGDKARYIAQLPGTERVLEECQDPRILSYWQIIKAAGRAMPQEEFVRG